MMLRQTQWLAIMAWAFAGLLQVHAGQAGEGARWRYTLLDPSFFVDDCPICGRPTIVRPMRGTFDLVLRAQNPLFSEYTLEGIDFRAPGFGADPYLITGSGSYQFGGEVAYIQQMLLELQVNGEPPGGAYRMQNDDLTVPVSFPMIDCTVRIAVSPTLEYTLRIVAAPYREIWFSTASGLTPGVVIPLTPESPDHISSGDVLASDGRVVIAEAAILASLGLDADMADANLDALDVGPGGEVFFSLREDLDSPTLGPIQHGDLLSLRGRIVRRSQELVARFQPMPPAADLGLDALELSLPAEVLFSVREGFFSERLGQFISPGDLLSDAGEVRRTNKELLARFHSLDGGGDRGLDACVLFQPDESMLGAAEDVWFSLEEGFEDGEFGHIAAGDLLSAQGRVVRHNLELVAPFAPIEDLADFGLDGLFVVTDTFLPADPPRITGFSWNPGTARVELHWEGRGRVFQVECAPAHTGPYEPASAIVPWLTAAPAPRPGGLSPAFFRVRQW